MNKYIHKYVKNYKNFMNYILKKEKNNLLILLKLKMF